MFCCMQVPASSVATALHLQLAHALGDTTAASSTTSALQQQLQSPETSSGISSSGGAAGWSLPRAFAWLQLGHAQLAQVGGTTAAAILTNA